MIQIILAVIILVICLYFKWQLSYWKRKHVDGPSPLPFFGNLFDYIITKKRSFGDIYSDIYRAYPKARYVGIFKATSKALLIRDLDLIKEILVTGFASFNKNDWFVDPKIDPLLAANPFMIPGDEWKPVRNQLAPLFTASRTRIAIPYMNDIKKRMLEYLEGGPENLDEIDAKEIASKYLTDLVASHAFGIEGECFTNTESELRKIGHALFNPTFWNGIRDMLTLFLPGVNKFLKVPFVPKDVDERVRNIVNQVIKDRTENKIVRNDLLQSVLEMKDKLKDFDEYLIPGHSFSFLTEGYETSSLIMSFTLYELAINPEVQKKAQKEIDEGFKQTKEEITEEFLEKLDYVERCILETCRMHSPVYQLTKICIKDYEFPGQYEDSKDRLMVEPEVACVIPVHAIHYDPEHFPNPYKYEPDRFLPEAKESRHKYAFLGFGDGPRICIGMKYGVTQSKAGVAAILRNYDLSLAKNCAQPLKISKSAFMHYPEDGILLKFTKRERN